MSKQRMNEMVDYGKGVQVPRADAIKCINDLHHYDDDLGALIQKVMPFVIVVVQFVILGKLFLG